MVEVPRRLLFLLQRLTETSTTEDVCERTSGFLLWSISTESLSFIHVMKGHCLPEVMASLKHRVV